MYWSQQTTVFGVVHYSQRLQTDQATKPTSSGGPLCDSPEHQASGFCITLPRPGGSGDGCSQYPLGHVGSPLPIPTNTTDIQSVSKTGMLIVSECPLGDSRNPSSAMVHGSETARGPINPSGSTPDTESSGQGDVPPTTFETTRLDIIKKAYRSRFPGCPQTVELLSRPLREVSLRDYERKWRRLCTFLKSRDVSPSAMTLKDALEFFTYLFSQKKLRPITVGHYRSALSKPLKLQFGIDLNDPAVNDLIKGMSIKRPKMPVTAPSWDINKVLIHLEAVPDYPALETLLQKAAFLLLLATGYRISELQACV